MKRTIFAAAAVAITAFAPRAHAQVASPIHVGVSGGISFPSSDAVAAIDGESAAKSKSGYNVAGLLGFQLPVFPVGLRAEVGYNKFQGKDLTITGGTGHADVGVFSGTLNAILQPAGLMPLKPYLIGGVGAYRVKHDATGNSFGETSSISMTKTAVGFNGGVGLQFGLGSLSTFLEARYHYVSNKETCSNNTSFACIPHPATSFIPVSFGIMF